MICYNDKCSKRFEKGIGVIEDENWYCSQECANTCEYRNILLSNLEDNKSEPNQEEEYEASDDEYEYDPMNDF